MGISPELQKVMKGMFDSTPPGEREQVAHDLAQIALDFAAEFSRENAAGGTLANPATKAPFPEGGGESVWIEGRGGQRFRVLGFTTDLEMETIGPTTLMVEIVFPCGCVIHREFVPDTDPRIVACSGEGL